NRIRNGFLSESDVRRKPPHGNVLIRNEATLLTRLRAEVKRSRRLRRSAATASIPPDPGKSLRQSVDGESSVSNCAMTSRTNRTLKGSKSERKGGDYGSPSRKAAKTSHRVVSCWGENRSDLPRPTLCKKLALQMESALPGRRSGMGQEL